MNFGDTIKKLRLDKCETLHQVSMGTDIDVTLLSKFERNIRLPTNIQIERMSKHFNTSNSDLAALVISDKIVKEYGLNDVTNKAINLVREKLSSYSTNFNEINK